MLHYFTFSPVPIKRHTLQAIDRKQTAKHKRQRSKSGISRDDECKSVRKTLAKNDRYKISLFGMRSEIRDGHIPNVFHLSHPSIEAVVGSCPDPRGSRVDAFIFTLSNPLELLWGARKTRRYQFEAAYQNNDYIFINIWLAVLTGNFWRPWNRYGDKGAGCRGL